MAIPTTRTRKTARIRIDEKRCTGCGLCVSVCKDDSLVILKQADGTKKAGIVHQAIFGCFGCGHCMAVCPARAVTIQGRTLSPADLFDLPAVGAAAGYDPLLALFRSRRSIREFTDQPVDPVLLHKILDAAATAPMGLPPSDVNVLVWNTREKGRAFARDYCTYLEGMKWLVSNGFLSLMRPFWGKATNQVFREFVRPLIQVYTENMKKGINLVNYDAPLTLYFYGSPYCDPADPVVAATLAMVAGQSLGLGTCMLGGIHPLIQTGARAAAFRKKHQIRYPSREGLFVIFGHPRVRYQKGIKRTFASVNIL